MKTSTKWIIGILIGLVILIIIGTLGIFAFGRFHAGSWIGQDRPFTPWNDEMGKPWRDMPMQPFNRSFNRMSGFSPLGMIFGGMIWVGILTLISLGVIALVRYLRSPRVVNGVPFVAPVSPLEPSNQDVSEPIQSESPVCPSCGHAIQSNWSHCPFCGTKVS